MLTRILLLSLTASTLLTDYIKWPGLAQVYQYRCQRENNKTGEITYQTQYGISSLTVEVASAKDLLKLRREHWTIENKVVAYTRFALQAILC